MIDHILEEEVMKKVKNKMRVTDGNSNVVVVVESDGVYYIVICRSHYH